MMKRGCLVFLLAILFSIASSQHSHVEIFAEANVAFPITDVPDVSVQPQGPPQELQDFAEDLQTHPTSYYADLLEEELDEFENGSFANTTANELRRRFRAEKALLLGRINEVLNNLNRLEYSDDLVVSAKHALIAILAIHQHRKIELLDHWFDKTFEYGVKLRVIKELRVKVLNETIKASLALDRLVEICKNNTVLPIFSSLTCDRSSLFGGVDGLLTGITQEIAKALKDQLEALTSDLNQLSFLTQQFASQLAQENWDEVFNVTALNIEVDDYHHIAEVVRKINELQYPRWDEVQASLRVLIAERLPRLKALIAAHFVGFTIGLDGDAEFACTGQADSSSKEIRCTYSALVTRKSEETLAEGGKKLTNIVKSFFQSFTQATKVRVEVEGPDQSGGFILTLVVFRVDVEVIRDSVRLITNVEVDNATVKAAVDAIVNEIIEKKDNLEEVHAQVLAKLEEARSFYRQQENRTREFFDGVKRDLEESAQTKVNEVKKVVEGVNADATALATLLVNRFSATLEEKLTELNASVNAFLQAEIEVRISIEVLTLELIAATKAAVENTDETLQEGLDLAVEFAKSQLAEVIRLREKHKLAREAVEEARNQTETKTREALEEFQQNVEKLRTGVKTALSELKQKIRADKEKFFLALRTALAAYLDTLSDIIITFGSDLEADASLSLTIKIVIIDNGVSGELAAKRREKHIAILKAFLVALSGRSDVTVQTQANRKRQTASQDEYSAVVGEPSTTPTPSSGSPTSTGTPTNNAPVDGSGSTLLCSVLLSSLALLSAFVF